jgi:hypothetical protein
MSETRDRGKNPYDPPSRSGHAPKNTKFWIWTRMKPLRFGLNMGFQACGLIMFTFVILGGFMDRVEIIMTGFLFSFGGFFIVGIAAGLWRARAISRERH